MVKFCLYMNKDKETVWLNEMAAKGYAMKSFFAGFYAFEQCEPGKYLYQVDFGEKFFRVSDDYKQFMEETGVEIVQTWGYWVFVRKPASEGEFQLYTDVDSSIEHYTKILKMFKAVTIIEIICFCMEIVGFIQGSEAAIAGMFLIGAIVLGCINAAAQTQDIIAKLKERRGEKVSQKSSRNVSPLLAGGILVNCLVNLWDIANANVRHTIQILALVLMIAGLFHQAMKTRRDDGLKK